MLIGSSSDSVSVERQASLIETEDGRWFCEGCTGDVDGDELRRAAVVLLVGNYWL